MNKDIDKNSVKDFLSNLQTKIIEAIQIVDGKNFLIDSWQRTEGGGGTTAILENGIKIQVPPFIESGDSIIIDTRTMEYVKKI